MKPLIPIYRKILECCDSCAGVLHSDLSFGEVYCKDRQGKTYVFRGLYDKPNKCFNYMMAKGWLTRTKFFFKKDDWDWMYRMTDKGRLRLEHDREHNKTYNSQNPYNLRS